MTPPKSLAIKVFFGANGFGPFECYECGGEVEFEDTHVHHIDEDQENNCVENLAAIHGPCHARLHRRTERSRIATREGQRAANALELLCEVCGAGPFRGKQGLGVHRAKGCPS